MFNWRYTVLMVIGVAIDQVTKDWARESLSQINERVIIPNILSLQLVFNKGAAYGIFYGKTLFLTLFSLVVILLAFIFQKQCNNSVWTRLGLTFIVIGAIGNVIDRILFGEVTDLFNIYIIPVFNVADMTINFGIVCFVVDYILSSKRCQNTT